jgi:methylated-DNA-[protein]-cysteine S-methyltransferase
MSSTYLRFDSPLGPMLVIVNAAGALTRVSIGDEARGELGAHLIDRAGARAGITPALVDARSALLAYANGSFRGFGDLRLAPRGTPFQQRVWAELTNIPYGALRSYGDLAMKLNTPKASRAVGRANGMNPLAIIVPCHRVVGADGRLVGFRGGVELKRRLLEHEGQTVAHGKVAL